MEKKQISPTCQCDLGDWFKIHLFSLLKSRKECRIPCKAYEDMITNMTRLDPAQRANIDEVLKHPWWSLEKKG